MTYNALPLHVVYSDVYLDWLLGAGDGSHPTNPVRAKLATELLVERLGAAVKVLPPVDPTKVEADLAALKSLHDVGYVTRTLQGDNGEWVGNKPHVAAAGFAMFQGSIRALEAILDGKAVVAFNPQGAKHHAKFGHASGFCVFNDMAYAAKALVKAGLRPLYIDWDVHAGDGVMHMLKGTGVATISIHNANGYPSDAEMQSFGVRGELHDAEAHNYNFNVLSGDGDDVFKEFIDAAAEIIDRYKPDVILLAAGADGHTGFGNLGSITNYTAEGFRYASEMIAEKAVAYSGGRVLIGGAGGYQPLVETPQTWALVVETIYNKVNSALAELANQPADLATETAELAMKGKAA
jgi:acetoin utilization protein AcuC